MDYDKLETNVRYIAGQFAKARSQRQARRDLVTEDFHLLREAGFPLVAVPVDDGGLWQSEQQSVRPICSLLRTLAGGDSSVALVASIHPAVLSYWLTAPAELNDPLWRQQCRRVFGSVIDGHWWGTITSEPGSGGDITKSRTKARPAGAELAYRISGQKHFGSGSGVMSYMVTTAVPMGEEEADWFFVDVRDVLWDGTAGLTMMAEWVGHGMAATQSHAMAFENYPATRMAWMGNLLGVATRAGGFIGCLFTSVIVGIVDEAIRTAREKLDRGELTAFEQVEWTRAQLEHWLISQAFEGMLRAVEQQDDPRHDVLQGKTAVAELAETVMTRLCRAIGGSTFSRRSPFGFWFEDVRALGFLRPPWNLAFATLAKGPPPAK